MTVKTHRKGSKAEKAHAIVDSHPKEDRDQLLTRIKRLGVKTSTASHWLSNWRGKAKPAAKKKAKSKKASKTETTTNKERA